MVPFLLLWAYRCRRFDALDNKFRLLISYFESLRAVLGSFAGRKLYFDLRYDGQHAFVDGEFRVRVARLL